MTNEVDQKAAFEPPFDCLVGRIARFRRPIGGSETYKVTGWYLDANGCLKTYGSGYAESFTCDTTYAPNASVSGAEPQAERPTRRES